MKAGFAFRIAAAGLIAFSLAWLAGCQTEDPPPAETFLRVRLNDSLARYEKVIVQILDRDDTSRVLYTLWNGPLQQPASDIPGYNLKNLGSQEFVVRVMGYKALGQLALQTFIYYAPGTKTVRHDTLPPLQPLDWLVSLKPSVGELAPPFSRDTSRYLLKMPQGVSSLAFTATAPLPSVQIRAEGQPVPSGTATKIFQIGNAPDSVAFTVTDTSTGASATREYRVVLIPTPPPGVYLSSLVPSVGALNVDFKPENTLYVLFMPPDKDTISFRASPADPRSMTVTIEGQAVFPGEQSKVVSVKPGASYTVGIFVRRGNELGYYQITLDHTQTVSH